MLLKRVFGYTLLIISLLLLASCGMPFKSLESESQIYKARVLWPGYTESTNIAFKVHDGLAIAEGDIILGKAEDFVGQVGVQGVVTNAYYGHWPNKTIPYRFSPSISENGQANALDAMATWSELTSTRFVERSTEVDYVEFVAGDTYNACSSDIGRSGGRQEIRLLPSGDCRLGAIIHELGHTIGLLHEHTRADRDNYVTIQTENIDPQSAEQFDLRPDGGQIVGAYDYDSIMHYSAYAFSKNSQPTIVPKNGVPLSRIGQTNSPSAGDQNAVKQLYETDKTASQLQQGISTDIDDMIDAVALTSRNDIYVLSHRQYKNKGNRTEWTLHRIDQSGIVSWVRQGFLSCGQGQCEPIFYKLEVDSNGSAYIVSSYRDATGRQDAALTKVSRDGVKTWGLDLYQNINPDVAIDASGSVYVLSNFIDSSSGQKSSLLSKYTATGDFKWERTTNIGNVTSVAVTKTGSAYIVGSGGMSLYTSGGNLTWKKTGTNYSVGSNSDMVNSDSNIYVRNQNEIRRYDLKGVLLWKKPQSGLQGIIIQDLAVDLGGNVYLSGKFAAGSGNWNAFVRKLNSSGSVVWTKNYGTPAYDDALSIATISGSDIFVDGITLGSLAHTNFGGRDGYLRKLNSSGNPVWTK